MHLVLNSERMPEFILLTAVLVFIAISMIFVDVPPSCDAARITAHLAPKKVSCPEQSFTYLFTGCGFSGTGLASAMMKRVFGLDIGHETTGRDGTSSWWAAFKCYNCGHGLQAISPEMFCKTIVLVRSPLGIVESGFGSEWHLNGEWGFVEKHMRRRNQTEESWPIQCRFVLWWLVYTEQALQLKSVVAVFRTGIDSFYDLATRKLGLSCNATCRQNIETMSRKKVNAHKRLHSRNITWNELEMQCDRDLITSAKTLAKRLRVITF